MPENINPLFETAKETLAGIPEDLLRYAVLGVAVLVVLLLLYLVGKKVLRRKREAPAAAPDLTIDVTKLGTEGPPAGMPALEFYYLPVRLAAVVLAPAGRVSKLPPSDQLDEIFDAIVPGLAKIVARHQPSVRRWPNQLSTRGFAHAFFQHVRLPGDGGKGTPWSSVAGVVKIRGQSLVAGLVLRTAQPTSHGQEIIDLEGKWLSMLRVQGA